MNTVIYEVLSKFINIIKGKLNIEKLPEKIKTQILDHLKSYKNIYLSPPYTQVMLYLEAFLREPSVTPKNKVYLLNKLNSIEDENIIKNFTSFLRNFMERARFEWIIQGNLTRDESIEIANKSEKILQNEKILREDEIASYRICEIPRNSHFSYTIKNDEIDSSANQNSSIACYFQFTPGNLSNKEKCILYLIESLLKEKFFDELRTKQTLGYIVKLFHREMRKVEGILCLVQSANKSPNEMRAKIDDFLNNIKKTFDQEITEEIFSLHKNSVITELEQKDLKLLEEVLRNFSEIKKREFQFRRKDEMVNILKNLKLEDVREAFEKIFFREVRRLDIELLANIHQEQENVSIRTNENSTLIKVDSVNEFKKRVNLFPDYFAIYNNNPAKF
jgi:secreted Zn-dependent insulinase-like peptidase